ncbi:Sugar/inositol transporter [Parasponia andersonii]|uniref:Sugar/inositol transporter n=1 Tax=Parasponia andersonii TaxID=3476 RepID=A0A2P5D364_PARAD|nr:Sugar/inositol transporter [Parasponia andersonii]
MMLGASAVPSVALALGVLKLPESPRWLVMQGRLRDAKKVLALVCDSKEETELRLHDIKRAAGIDENCEEENGVVKVPASTSRGEGVWRELLLKPSPAVRWILIASVGLHFFDHTTGIEVVVLYSPRLFSKAGVSGKDRLLLATVGMGLCKTAFTLVATFLLDKVGRRPLLLTSVGGMIFALSGLGFCLTMAEHSKEKLLYALSLSIVFVYLYVAFFSIGIGPITWVYSSEIFPLRLRAQGTSIGGAVSRIMNGTVSMTFISICQAITIGGTLFVFAGIAVLAWIFFYFFLPETKGRSLEEIETLFARNVSKPGNSEVEIQRSDTNGCSM